MVDPELLGDIFSRDTSLKELFCPLSDFLVDHGGALSSLLGLSVDAMVKGDW